MATSLLLAAIVLGIALLSGWGVVHFGRRAGQSEAKLKALLAMFVVGGACLSVFAFLADFEIRRSTLFEEVLEHAAGFRAGTVLERSFQVEHDGVPHELMLVPRPAPGDDAHAPVVIGIALRDPAGALVIGETRRFETWIDGIGSSVSRRRVWESRAWTFSPATTGTWDLRLTLETGGLPAIHVRVEDPLKRDGARAPGY